MSDHGLTFDDFLAFFEQVMQLSGCSSADDALKIICDQTVSTKIDKEEAQIRFSTSPNMTESLGQKGVLKDIFTVFAAGLNPATLQDLLTHIFFNRSLNQPADSNTVCFDAGSSFAIIKDEIKTKLDCLSLQKTCLRHVLNLSEELFMNATKDALVESGRNEHLQSQLQFKKTPHSLVIHCTDHYGAFNLDKFTKYLSKIKHVGSNSLEVDNKAHGAGLGILKILHHCHGYFALVNPGKWTRVSSIIELKKKISSPLHSNKSFGYTITHKELD